MTEAIPASLLSDVLARAPQFERAVHLPDVLKPDVIAGLVLDGVTRLCNDDDGARDRDLRLWRAQSADEAVEQHLFQMPPHSGEDLSSWATRVFSGDRWGMVLNHAERWLVEIADDIARKSSALMDPSPPPSTRLELVLFAGNYDRTPFGFHTDPPNVRALHLHVGPGTKEIYVDEDGTACLDRFSDPQAIADRCDRHVLQPGDAFLIPAHKAHMGTCQDLNIAVALVMRREFKSTIFEQAMGLALHRLGEAVELPADPSRFSISENVDAWPEFAPERAPLNDWIATAVKDYGRQMKSNAGFTKSPMPLACRSPGVIQLRPEFPLSAVRRSDGRLTLFARGECFDLPERAGLWDWLALLTSGQPIVVSDTASRCRLDQFTADAIAELLVTHHAAERIA